MWGARPLKRAIQRLMQGPLAMMLLEGRFSEGDAVVVDVRDGAIASTKADAAGRAGAAI